MKFYFLRQLDVGLFGNFSLSNKSSWKFIVFGEYFQNGHSRWWMLIKGLTRQNPSPDVYTNLEAY